MFAGSPSAADGVTFDAELIPVDGHVAIPSEGPVAIIPKAALPDGVYTVTITMGTPPAEAPEGYELIGGGDFTIVSGDAEVEQFEEGHPASLWIPLFELGMDEEDYKYLALFYYDEAEEEWVKLDSVIDGDFLKAETAHWSYFALMGEEDPTGEEEPTLPETGTGFMWLVPLGLLLLLTGVVVRKRVAA